MHQYVQAAMTIISLVNPVICMTMFMDLEGDRLAQSGLKEANKAALAIFIILVATALIGVRVLGIFGISLDAFQVAGGIVLSWMGFSMLKGTTSHTKAHQPTGEQVSPLTPLILFAASPGTITGVITISVNHSGVSLPVTTLVGVAAAVGITWILMAAATRSGRKRKSGGLFHDVSTRFMGLIVLAMGIQFSLMGLQKVLKIG